LLGEISITSDMQMTPPCGGKQEELKSLLMKVKEESEILRERDIPNERETHT